MATARRHSGGIHTVPYTPSVAADDGQVVVQNSLVGVANSDLSASRLGALSVDGLFWFPTAEGSSSAIAAGKKVYWDANNEVATETASGNTYLGKTVTAAADGDDEVLVFLEQ